jgi:hypothetical protein
VNDYTLISKYGMKTPEMSGPFVVLRYAKIPAVPGVHSIGWGLTVEVVP